MSVYQHILVALDGSDQSEKAFHEAVRIAKEEQATLYLATIINDAEFTTSPFSFEELYDLENTSQKRCSLKRQNKRVKLV